MVAIIYKIDQLLDHFEELITFLCALGKTLKKLLKQRNLSGNTVSVLTKNSFHTFFLMAIPISFIIIFL